MDDNQSNPQPGDSFIRLQRRALTESELSLLKWLMANGSPDAERYQSQIADLNVVAECTCGCPTIDLAVGNRVRRTIGASHILADFEGMTPEGVTVGVTLHAREGQLSELEVAAISEVDGPFNLPDIKSLKKC
jgi:hypothetical protein